MSTRHSCISVNGSNKVKFNGTTVRAIAIMGALAKATGPLRVDDIIEGMMDFGVLPMATDGRSEISNTLQKLLEAGAVHHPEIHAGKRLYCLT